MKVILTAIVLIGSTSVFAEKAYRCTHKPLQGVVALEYCDKETGTYKYKAGYTPVYFSNCQDVSEHQKFDDCMDALKEKK